jgi:hypothetical protein
MQTNKDVEKKQKTLKRKKRSDKKMEIKNKKIVILKDYLCYFD